jgi:hypothetical protein
MKYSKNAINFDLAKKYREAIHEYEVALQKETLDVNLYINLAFLYWLSASSFAWADKYEIPMKVRERAIDRYKEVLKEAKLKFPECAELYFWEKYFWHRLVFDSFTEEDTLKIISEHAYCTEVPYFFLYLFDKKKYGNERNKLLKKCMELPTAKNLYIESIIEDR